MRSYSTLAVGSGTLLLLVVVAAVLLVLASRGPRSDVLAVVRPSATAAPATRTPAPRPTATPVPSPTAQPAQPTTQPAVVPPVEQVAREQPPPPPPPPTQPAAQPAPERFDYDFAAQVLGLINAERSTRGLSALVANGALTASAQGYARTLLQLNALSHNADGTDLLSRVRAAGYTDGPPLGEALWGGTGSFSPREVVAGWLGSPTHAAILLNAVYSVAGVGCYVRQNGDAVDMRCVLDVAG